MEHADRDSSGEKRTKKTEAGLSGGVAETDKSREAGMWRLSKESDPEYPGYVEMKPSEIELHSGERISKKRPREDEGVLGFDDPADAGGFLENPACYVESSQEASERRAKDEHLQPVEDSLEAGEREHGETILLQDSQDELLAAEMNAEVYAEQALAAGDPDLAQALASSVEDMKEEHENRKLVREVEANSLADAMRLPLSSRTVRGGGA